MNSASPPARSPSRSASSKPGSAFKLFERLPQGVSLTEPAREALPRLTRGFSMVTQVVQDLRDTQASRGARALRIAALPCIAQLWLSPRLVALQQAFPGLRAGDLGHGAAARPGAAAA